MTRKSEREIARALDDLSDGDRAPATLEELLRADETVPTGRVDDDPIWRVDGVEKSVSKSVRGDLWRIGLGGQPKYHDPPEELVREHRPDTEEGQEAR